MADRNANFDEFYRATNRRLLQYAYAMTSDLATAQDLTQEAYIRAWRNWAQVEGFERADAWLRVVVTRLVTDRWRRIRTSRRFGAYQRPSTVPPPSEDSVLLVTALRRLPVAQRRAICLYHLLDVPVAEIAAEAGVAEGTVKSWLARGRATLAEILGPDAFLEAPKTATARGDYSDA